MVAPGLLSSASDNSAFQSWLSVRYRRVETILREIFWPALRELAYFAIFSVPTFGFTFFVIRQRKKYDEEAEDPFTDLLTRPAGETLRSQIEELREKQQEALLARFIVAIVSALIASTVQPPLRLLVGIALGVLVLVDLAIAGPKIYRLTTQLRDLGLGYTGERVVAEHLNSLLATGYLVFHDVPFENFNIDHVIVGPSGVFSVETKTRRKPKHQGKKSAWKIVFDGKEIHWPKFSESDSLNQAQAGARSVSKLLTGATGERIYVQPILTTPGWWIDDNVEHAVWVLNPKRIKSFVEASRRSQLEPAQVQRIISQLTKSCRLAA